MALVAPSLLSSDFTRLGEEIRDVESAGADWLHVDVMDGHFVPNITMGPVVVSAIARAASVPVDVHLMIDRPDRYWEDFIEAGADWLTFHVEVPVDHVHLARRIRDKGVKAGISLNPATPASSLEALVGEVDLVLVMTVNPGFGGQSFMPEVVPKVGEVRRMMGPGVRIAVDGGINPETARLVVEEGADVLVAGTAVFAAKDRAVTIRAMKETG